MHAKTLIALSSALALGILLPARAAWQDAYAPAEEYNPPAANGWWDVGTGDMAAATQRDRAYIAGMLPHHAGAVTMSEAYLRDSAARSTVLRQLAQAIIQNQSFEIVQLREVARVIELPERHWNLGLLRLTLRPLATEGLGAALHVIRAPVPVFASGPAPNEVDVRFARMMQLHHRAALDMARAYNADPLGRNRYLQLLNVGIVTDQSQEIALMERVIARYAGDAAAVQVDPMSIPGMDHMHMGH